MNKTLKPTAARTEDKVMPAMSLSQLCSEAADHVACARLWLFDESADADRALLHLDEAIFCLKRLLAQGRGMAESRERRSA
jgi:hypothetical protein